MKAKTGMYFYARCGRGFQIYRYDSVTERGTAASPLRGEPHYYNREEARKRVYELNGWKYTGK